MRRLITSAARRNSSAVILPRARSCAQPGDRCLDFLALFDPGRREAVVPQQPVRHAQRGIFERIVVQRQRLPAAGEVLERALLHGFLNFAVGNQAERVHHFSLPFLSEIFLEPVLQRAQADSQLARGMGAVARIAFERFLNRLPLYLFPAAAGGADRPARSADRRPSLPLRTGSPFAPSCSRARGRSPATCKRAARRLPTAPVPARACPDCAPRVAENGGPAAGCPPDAAVAEAVRWGTCSADRTRSSRNLPSAARRFRSRLVAARMRTSTVTRREPPTRSKLRSCSTRSSLVCRCGVSRRSRPGTACRHGRARSGPGAARARR